MILNKYLSCGGQDCFTKNKFTTDFNNGIINHVSYRGLSLEQRPEIIDIFHQLIQQLTPTRIIEIGTFAGGLTLILKDILEHLNINATIYTYDISKPRWLINHIESSLINNIIINTDNIFNNYYNDFIEQESESKIRSLISSEGTTIVLCDGGCKKCEFNLLSQFLKYDDIIMAHDYAPNTEYFQQHMKDKIWNWHEIQDSDIIESCQKYGLQPYMKEEFLKVAWACFKKE